MVRNGSAEYKIGDVVIFRIVKRSSHPGRRAAQISPEPRGEDYLYEVDKYWMVSDRRQDGTVVLLTRRGKQHVVQCNNPRLRPAKWWERVLYRNRFPSNPVSMPPLAAG